MIVKKIGRTLIWIVAACNVLVVMGMLVCAYSDHLNPESYPVLSISGLFFPIILVVNILFLILWSLFYWKGLLIPILGLIACFPAIRLYYPINAKNEIPDGSIKVMSYNVLMFAPWELEKGTPNPIVEFIMDSDADIVCLQEANPSEAGGEALERKFKARYPYYDVTKKAGGESLTICSKFPILSKDTMDICSTGNMSVAYVLDINGDKTLVINNHLETVGLSFEEKDDFEKMVNREMAEYEAKAASRSLIRKLTEANKRRASQADVIAQVIAEYRAKGYSVMVFGDFNDTPLSYTFRTIGKGLTDAFSSSGRGLGYTYQKNGMNVRIDHILCSDDWTPYGAQVNKEIYNSDHFPVICWLKKQAKQ